MLSLKFGVKCPFNVVSAINLQTGGVVPQTGWQRDQPDRLSVSLIVSVSDVPL